jgi:hypothetical protein
MRIFLILIALFIISCKKDIEIKPHSIKEEKEKSVAEIISELSKSDTITHLDLSHKKLDSIPDISMYKIISLDLSHNNLDTIPLSKLPLTLKKFKCTDNKLRKFMLMNYKNSFIPEMQTYHNSDLQIEEIDLSNNQLEVVTIKVLSIHRNKILPKKIIVSNNTIEHLAINDNINYLDISNNPNINPEVLFAVEKIDTLLQTNNPKVLKTKRIAPPKNPIICTFDAIYATFPKKI